MTDDRIPIFQTMEIDKAKENPKEFYKGVAVIAKFLLKQKIGGPFVLMRDAKPIDISKVVLPPELKTEYTDVEINEKINPELREAFENFSTVITQNIPQENLVNFYNNINTLKVNDGTETPEKTSLYDFLIDYQSVKNIKGADGIYSPIGNVFSVGSNNDLDAVYHELLHLSSSVKADKSSDTFFSGFSQAYLSKKDGLVKIGDGLNEGYTEFLRKRYFPSDNEGPSSYELMSTISGKVEELIGKDKMESLYFNANLPGLIDALKEYADEKDIMEFIANTDFLIKHYDDTKTMASRMCINAVDNSLDFLIKCRQKKLAKEFKEGKYQNAEEALKELLTYCVTYNGFDYNGFIFKIENYRDKLQQYPRNIVIEINGKNINYSILQRMAELLNLDGLKELVSETVGMLYAEKENEVAETVEVTK